MIIAVNIGKSLNAGKSPQDATERAWSLSYKNCRKHDYVIGVAYGVIIGYFRLNYVFADNLEPERVAFNLSLCSNADKKKIDSHIKTQGVNLRLVKHGKYI